MARIQQATKPRRGTAHKRVPKGSDHDYSVFEFNEHDESQENKTDEKDDSSSLKPPPPRKSTGMKAAPNNPHSSRLKYRKRRRSRRGLAGTSSASDTNSDDSSGDTPPARKIQRTDGRPKEDLMEWSSLDSLSATANGNVIDRDTLKAHPSLIEGHRKELHPPPTTEPRWERELGGKFYGWKQQFNEEYGPVRLTYSGDDTESESIMVWEAILISHMNKQEKRDSKRRGLPVVGRGYKLDSSFELSVDIGEPYVGVGSLQQFFEHHCLTKQTAMPENSAAALVLDMMLCVGHAHKHGVSHNDLGLDSFLITRRNGIDGKGKGRYRLLLLGFGVKACALSSTKAAGLPSDGGAGAENPFSRDLLMVARLIWMLITGDHSFDVTGAPGRKQLPWSLKNCVALQVAETWEKVLLELLNPPSTSCGLNLGTWAALDVARNELESIARGFDWCDEFHFAGGGSMHNERVYDFPLKLTDNPRTAALKDDEETPVPRQGGRDEADKILIGLLEDNLEKQGQTLHNTEKDKSELISRKKALEEEVGRLVSQTQARGDEVVSLTRELEGLQSDDAIKARTIDKLQSEMQALRDTLKRSESEKADLTERNEKLEGEIIAKDKEMETLRTRHGEAIKSITVELEEAASKLKKQKDLADDVVKKEKEKAAAALRRVEKAAKDAREAQARVTELELEKQLREQAGLDVSREYSALETEVTNLREDLLTTKTELFQWRRAGKKLQYRTLELKAREQRNKRAAS